MKKELKVLLGLSVVILLGIFVANRFYQNEEKTNTAPSVSSSTSGQYGITLRQEFVREDSHTQGPETAKVSLVEFLDPECEACRAFYPVVKQILKEYEGKIYFVVRYMVLHNSSAMAIAATESAGLQGKYWEMQELLFNTADEWSHKPKPEPSYFIKYAGDMGLDTARFKTDLSNPKWMEKAKRDMADGGALGVKGTPTIFINGDKLPNLTYGALKAAIETHLNAK